MADERTRDISELFDDGTAIAQAMNAAVREAVLQHKQKGLPLVVWRDGKVAWIPPDEIDLGPDFLNVDTQVSRERWTRTKTRICLPSTVMHTVPRSVRFGRYDNRVLDSR